MTLDAMPSGPYMELDGDSVELLDLGKGKVQWEIESVAGQPGDSQRAKPFSLEMQGGFGASRRTRRGTGQQTDPTHHHFGRNVSAQYENIRYPAPRVTYMDGSSFVTRFRGFRVGNYPNSRIGGTGPGIGAIGGGSFNETPQYFREFNHNIYMHAGHYTFTIAPDADEPTFISTRDHGATARARWSDVFGNVLGVACGQGALAEWLIGPNSSHVDVSGTTVTTTIAAQGLTAYVVPANVHKLVVDIQGPKGGASGGNGGRVQATVAVTPLSTVYFNNGYYTDTYNASDMRIGGNTVADRKVVAGGGGYPGGNAAGTPYSGGAGGLPGTAGQGGSGTEGGGGQPATDFAPGSGGTGGSGQPGGSSGSGENGGVGGVSAFGSTYNGGRGGAGWFGGGGGGAATNDFQDDGEGGQSGGPHKSGAGGGGSNHADALICTLVTHTTGYATVDGHGRIIVQATPVTTNASTNADGWVQAELGVDVYRVGPSGRLFAAIGNKVYNVLPGYDPTLSLNYVPSNGEVITEVSEPIRSLVEFSSSLVAGTERTARTLDPNRGYQGVPVAAVSRLSASGYDGRALLSIGPILFHATRGGVQMIIPGRPPEPAGPEELPQNESPYVGMEWGVPDFAGAWMVWPAYIPASGDSVIFFARLRKPDEPGTGPLVWQDVIWLEGRECRAVTYWGGSATRGPRLFFGASTPANPYAAGWCDLGVGTGPDPFTTEGAPALEGYIESPLDDLGLPGVNKSAERVEIPLLEGVDANNTFKVSMQADDGAMVDFVSAQGSDPEVTTEGFVALYPPVDTPVFGRALRYAETYVQAEAATEFIKVRGTPVLYYTEVPSEVGVITTYADAKADDMETAVEVANAMRERYAGGTIPQRNGPDGVERYVKVIGCKATAVEVPAADNTPVTRYAVAVTMREVLVG